MCVTSLSIFLPNNFLVWKMCDRKSISPMIFVSGLFFASLCYCPFPLICVGGQRFMLKKSVIFRLTEPIYFNEKYFVEISDFAHLSLKAGIISMLLLASMFCTAVFPLCKHALC